jgi:hypothetical protein
MMTKKMGGFYMYDDVCPVCYKYRHENEDSYDRCPVCGWYKNLHQERHPDEEECENLLSLNEAREAYKKGEKVY